MKEKYFQGLIIIMAGFFLFVSAGNAFAIRIKDLAEIEGMRNNQLMGYGLVAGLNGTGDKDQTDFPVRSIVNMLVRLGVRVNRKDVKVKNVAAVTVTASLPPFAKPGNHIDVVVSSIGDAKSIQGGTLLQTPLLAADGRVYAVAQGPVSIGGFSSGKGGGKSQKNFPTVGRVPSGAIVERPVPFSFQNRSYVVFNLYMADFTTATRVTSAINNYLGQKAAQAMDAGTIRITIPKSRRAHLVTLMSALENLDVHPDNAARVVFNERTGTVVMGKDVRISTVAVAHGNLNVIIKEHTNVSQPLPFSTPRKGSAGPAVKTGGTIIAPGGQTVVTKEQDITVKEEKKKLIVLKEGASIGELVASLNRIGVTPRDLMAVLQAIHAAGALHGKLEIM